MGQLDERIKKKKRRERESEGKRKKEKYQQIQHKMRNNCIENHALASNVFKKMFQ